MLQNFRKSKIVVITGQTATGKTSLAYQYAKKLNGELINADSRQVYKHLDIISGKDLHPQVFTHLYDIVDPKEYFSSYEWQNHALQVIDTLKKAKKIPIIVGGSYLYLKHLLYGVDTAGIQPDWELRKRLDKKSVKELQDILKKTSLQTFELLNQSDRSNPRRLMRKIEIVLSIRHSGKRSASRFDSRQARMTPLSTEPNLSLEFIGLRFKEKELLTSKITKRVKDRIKMGAFEEVENLLKREYIEKDPGLQTIGYQQLIKFFKNNLTREQAIEEWTNKEIQYAKRQYTFMKTNKNITWKEI